MPDPATTHISRYNLLSSGRRSVKGRVPVNGRDLGAEKNADLGPASDGDLDQETNAGHVRERIGDVDHDLETGNEARGVGRAIALGTDQGIVTEIVLAIAGDRGTATAKGGRVKATGRRVIPALYRTKSTKGKSVRSSSSVLSSV